MALLHHPGQCIQHQVENVVYHFPQLLTTNQALNLAIVQGKYLFCLFSRSVSAQQNQRCEELPGWHVLQLRIPVYDVLSKLVRAWSLPLFFEGGDELFVLLSDSKFEIAGESSEYFLLHQATLLHVAFQHLHTLKVSLSS